MKMKQCTHEGCTNLIPEAEVHKYCPECREYFATRKRIQRNRYKERGDCHICGRTKIPGLQYCKHCQAQQKITKKKRSAIIEHNENTNSNRP